MRSVALWAAIYFIVWWIVLLAVLPWGVRSQHEAGGDILPGSDPGAPARPLLLRKALATTLIATAIVALGYGAWSFGLIGDRIIPAGLFPQLPAR